MRAPLLATLALSVMSLGGCGTILSHVVEHGDPAPYEGVHLDAFGAVFYFPLGTPLAVVDLPLSFAADTLLLPVHAVRALLRDGAAPAAPPGPRPTPPAPPPVTPAPCADPAEWPPVEVSPPRLTLRAGGAAPR